MKKSNLITGFVYLFTGVICLLIALLTENKLNGLLFGFACAGLCSGLLTICHYYYWTSSKNRERYQEKLEKESIEAHDELKEMIRDRSGRYAYMLGLIVISISTVLFSVMGSLEIIENAVIIVLYLFGYFVFQIIAGILIFNRMMKKY